MEVWTSSVSVSTCDGLLSGGVMILSPLPVLLLFPQKAACAQQPQPVNASRRRRMWRWMGASLKEGVSSSGERRLAGVLVPLLALTLRYQLLCWLKIHSDQYQRQAFHLSHTSILIPKQVLVCNLIFDKCTDYNFAISSHGVPWSFSEHSAAAHLCTMTYCQVCCQVCCRKSSSFNLLV